MNNLSWKCCVQVPEFCTVGVGARMFKWLIQGHTWNQWQTGCQVGWLPVLYPFSTPGQTETTVTGGCAVKTNAKFATGLIRTSNSMKGLWLQCFLGLRSATVNTRIWQGGIFVPERARLHKVPRNVLLTTYPLLLCGFGCIGLILWSPVSVSVV